MAVVRSLSSIGLFAVTVVALGGCGDSSRDGDDDGCSVFAETCAEDGSGAGSGSGPSGGNGATTGGGDDSAQQLCVDTINQYRASVGRPPLARWKSAESCSDGQALSDGQTDTPHGAFGDCGEWAQNECPGWPGPLDQLIAGCLDLMWDEGPGGGHYDNMENPQYTEVACGFATMSDGSIWAVQNFR